MQLKKLDKSFYADNLHLRQALDNHNGKWTEGKFRGYGIVIISIQHLSFAIPLRSNIKHKSSYLTVKTDNKGLEGKGLDFTKALLIKDPKYISQISFKIPEIEHKKLKNKELYITSKFEIYVSKYIKAVKNSNQNVLKNIDYRFSTLCNYHEELDLNQG